MGKKCNKKNLMTIREASETYGVPEQTWRSWWRSEDRPELQALFAKIKGTSRIFVDTDAVDESIEEDLISRMKLARDLDIR
jgi:hypothetical protein